jgi:hypothetical protein
MKLKTCSQMAGCPFYQGIGLVHKAAKNVSYSRQKPVKNKPSLNDPVHE